MGDGLDGLKALRQQQKLIKEELIREEFLPEEICKEDIGKEETRGLQAAADQPEALLQESPSEGQGPPPLPKSPDQAPPKNTSKERAIHWDALVNPREKFFFRVCAVLSLIFYLLGFLYVLILPILLISAWIAHGMMIGHIKGNGIRLSEAQFPAMYNKVAELSQQLGLVEAPTVYLLEQGGILNAFATRFANRDMIVIYADIAELFAEDDAEGQAAVSFVLAHELSHIARGHVSLWNRILTGPAEYIPFLGTAYSRACEYTCDRFAQNLEPAGALHGLSLLAVGKRLFGKVNTKVVEQDVNQGLGFWPWLSEIFSTHPHLLNRIQQLHLRANS
jgi:Zn-dependent protease with chaperone function